MPREAFVLKIQRELCHPKYARGLLWSTNRAFSYKTLLNCVKRLITYKRRTAQTWELERWFINIIRFLYIPSSCLFSIINQFQMTSHQYILPQIKFPFQFPYAWFCLYHNLFKFSTEVRFPNLHGSQVWTHVTFRLLLSFSIIKFLICIKIKMMLAQSLFKSQVPLFTLLHQGRS